DLLVLRYGARPILFSNLRDGTFADVAARSNLPSSGSYTAAAVGDINKDGATDFFLARHDAPGVIATSTGSGRFTVGEAPAGTANATAAQFLDYDNDGLLDLFVLTPGGARLWRNLGDSWSEVTASA